MIFGHLHQSNFCMPAVIESALTYLRQTDIGRLEPGRYQIDGDKVFVLVQDPMTQDWDTGFPEFHLRYIDIQYLFEGEEAIGFAPANRNLAKVKDQLLEHDIAFVNQQENESRLLLTPGMFAIFFPGELHRPCRSMKSSMRVKKIVVKILADLL